MRPKDICKVDFTVIGQRFREERDLNHFTRDYIAEVTGYSVKHIQDTLCVRIVVSEAK